MKKYACHRLYITPTTYIRMASVTIDGTGMVCSYTSLNEETSATEWIGGVILFTKEAEINLKSDFKELLEANMHPSEATLPSHAWHIANYDFANECLTAQSHIRPLNGKTIITL